MGCEIMKKIIYRILAYVFDILLVTLLTVGITQLPIFSDTNSEVGALYVNLSTIEMSYNTLNEKLAFLKGMFDEIEIVPKNKTVTDELFYVLWLHAIVEGHCGND